MRNVISIGVILAAFYGYPQSSLSFLNIPASARVAVLGGHAVTSTHLDLSMFFHNPALLDSMNDGQFLAMYNPYLADIQRLIAAYAISGEKVNDLAIGINFTGYGGVNRRDQFGNDLGSFTPRQYAVFIGKSTRVGPFSVGVNLKFAASEIDSYQRYGILSDLGGTYTHPNGELMIGMVFKNFGYEFGGVESGSFSDQLFDLQVGSTFKPMYMPFRFTITASNLTDYRQAFRNEEETVKTGDRILRYISLGTTLVLSEIIEISTGYNHQRSRELSLDSGGYGAGFSYGFLLRVREIEIRFSRISFHAAGGTSFISLQSNTNSIKKIF